MNSIGLRLINSINILLIFAYSICSVLLSIDPSSINAAQLDLNSFFCSLLLFALLLGLYLISKARISEIKLEKVKIWHSLFSLMYFLVSVILLFNLKDILHFSIFNILFALPASFFLFHVLLRTVFQFKHSSNLETKFALPFFFSGFSALIYQIAWQRVLFSSLGINIESVTLIVAIFMLGLGIGSLAGGLIAKKIPRYCLTIFSIAEICLAVFGIFSQKLILTVTSTINPHSILTISIVVFLLLILPTALMGLTLPLLVQYLVNRARSLQTSVSALYAINTLGAAIAAVLTVTVLFPVFGLKLSIWIAVFLNLVAALLAYWRKFDEFSPLEKTEISNSTEKIKAYNLYILAFAVGFISMSFEILWYRIWGIMSSDRPRAFGLLLALYLFGIALGSFTQGSYGSLSKRIQTLGSNLLAAPLLLSIVLWAIGTVLSFFRPQDAQYIAGFLIFLFAYFWGGIFVQLTSLIETDSQNSGVKISRLYLFNILGSTLGPLITGFVLLEFWGFTQTAKWVNLFGFISICVLLFGFRSLLKTNRRFLTLSTLSLFAIILSFYSNDLIPILYNQQTSFGVPRQIIENRNGVIASFSNVNGDVIYGGGVYDGRVNLDLESNQNGIDRVYFAGGLHPAPSQVLEIGLSVGSWLKILLQDERIKKITSIEINPGYYKLIKSYPEYADLLQNKKVEHILDDGRRWLRNNPERKFDLIVINTTFHWRANVTNLLSKEFQTLVKAHLNPGGVYYFNTTGSQDVIKTSLEVFKYVIRYKSFIAASDTSFTLTQEQKIKALASFQNLDRQPVLNQSWIDRISSVEMKPVLKQDFESFEVITDDNMRSEFSKL